MNGKACLSIGLLLCFLFSPKSSAIPRDEVLIYHLTGEASVRITDHPRPLRLYDRLPPGAFIQVGDASLVALAFASGKRYVLHERSRVRLGRKDLTSRNGKVRPLKPVHPLLPPVAPGTEPGRGSAVLPIRLSCKKLECWTSPGSAGVRLELGDLYPRKWAATLARRTILRFEPFPQAEHYRIEVYSFKEKKLVLTIETAERTVLIPAGKLREGALYVWRVRAVVKDVPFAEGTAGFRTLPGNVAAAREQLRTEAMTNPQSLPLLAVVDSHLGLWEEARSELEEVLDEKPEEPLLREALAEVKGVL